MATAFLTVGGVVVKTPSTFEVTIQDISAPDSGRDLSGLMHKNTVCQKRTIQIGWSYPTAQEMATIVNAFSASEYFTVKYWDPSNATTQQTRTFYCGDRPAAIEEWTTKNRLYDKFSINIIER